MSEAAVAGPDEGALLLEVRDLVVHYPVRRDLTAALRREPHQRISAVDGVSFSLRHGEMLALIGESGCGKTSTAQAILRMIDTTAGTIEVAGRDVTHLTSQQLRPIRRTMQMVYQDPYESLDPRFRVRRAVEEPLLIHGMAGSSAGAGRHHQVLAHGEVGEDAATLRDVGDPLLRHPERRGAGHDPAPDPDLALARLHQAEHALEQGRLPHAVAPHQADRLTARDAEVDAVQDVARPVVRVDAAGADQLLGHATSSPR
jgi:ABC-type dipeptide/oligopeptide/nickel transport system ATPase component